MNPDKLIASYELLADRGNSAFNKMLEEHGECIQCKPHCSDCCHAIFGLFLIEAVYIQRYFMQLDEKQRSEVLERCKKADRALENFEQLMVKFKDDPDMQAYTLAKERIRCPLLEDNDVCALYDHRPITCRVYGIPTAIHGKTRVCGKAAFQKGQDYPVFNLDGAYRNLFVLSKELLKEENQQNLDKAALLFSISKILQTTTEDLIKEDLERIDNSNTE